MPIRFAPSPKAPPWSYNFSEILRPPKAGQTVADVVARIRLFHRDGLLILGARILWQFWNNRELTNPTTPEGVGNYITWVNAERIISLGCTCASTTHRPFPKEVDFRLLCWELHGSLDTLSVASAKENEANQIIAFLRQAPADSLLSRFTALDTFAVAGEALKNRIAASQTVGRYWDKDQLFRSYLLSTELRALGLAFGGNEYARFARTFLLADLEGFFRAVLALLMKAAVGVPVEFPRPHGPEVRRELGRIDSADWPADRSLQDIGLSEDDLRAVASRLSIPLSEFAELRGDLAKLDPYSAKYSRVVDQLGTRPIIDLEFGSRSEQLLVPSPWKLLAAGLDFPLYEFVSFLHEHQSAALGGVDAYSLRGKAFERYLRSALPTDQTVVDVDRLKNVSGERPDFVWLGQDWGILIEAKFSLRPNTDRGVSVATSVLEMWRRAAEGANQAAVFLTNHRSRFESEAHPRRWAVVLVTSEHTNEEATGFANVSARADLLRGTPLEGLCLLDIGDLESWMHFSTADSLGAEISTAWISAKNAPFYEVFRIERPTKAAEPELPHIQQARSILLPGAVAGQN
jgi:hypothetical protein